MCPADSNRPVDHELLAMALGLQGTVLFALVERKGRQSGAIYWHYMRP